jgi:hypothetical protein
MTRPLDSTQAKLERAQHHLDCFYDEFLAIFDRDPVQPAIKDDPKTGDHIIWIKYIPEIPPTLGALLGDFLHNLRSALNHLAFELVRASGGLTARNEESIQFPIYDAEPTAPLTFKDKVHSCLRKVGDEPLAIIERYQAYHRPYMGRLAYLSNQDKHRTPVLLLSRVTVPPSGQVLL